MGSKTSTHLWRVTDGRAEPGPDELATEEPLEIRLLHRGESRVVAITMRTPGADDELAAGFLFAEGVVDRREAIRSITFPGPNLGILSEEVRLELGDNIVQVELDDDAPEPQLATLDRHFFATSACGVCGKAGLETLRLRAPGELPPGPEIAPAVLSSLPDRLREGQGIFAATGGLHAAALFDAAGNLLAVREDVGRHNALDKLLGRRFLDGGLPLHDHVVLVSGRSSYEILQKCLMAGVPVVCAVSAPSSLAVELAQRFGVTLVGFLRGGRFNVYSGIERIAAEGRPESARRPERLVRVAL
jgi:FdhD protein